VNTPQVEWRKKKILIKTHHHEIPEYQEKGEISCGNILRKKNKRSFAKKLK
jgi:hypothetical protein